MAVRFDPVRALLGVGVLACLAATAFVHPGGAPAATGATWIRIGDAALQGKHVPLYTFVIDAADVGGSPRPFAGKPVALRPGQSLDLRGWAYDPGFRRTADRMLVRVDGGAWHDVRYHLARPDVATALGIGTVADSGFEADVDTAALPAGRHTIELATQAAPYAPNPLPVRVELDVSSR